MPMLHIIWKRNCLAMIALITEGARTVILTERRNAYMVADKKNIEIRKVENGYELTVDGEKIGIFTTPYDAAKYVENMGDDEHDNETH